MSSVIGSLRVNLGLDSAQFIKGTKQAEASMNGMSLKMAAAGAAIGAALGTAAAAFINLARESINTADEISKAAVKIGISTEELSRLRYAADLSGLSFEQLQKGLLILNRNMAGVGGESKKVSEAFARMGIETRNADGTLKSSTQVLKEMADVFQGMPDGAEKSALAMAVLGKSGADMIPLINGGSAALQQLTDEADQFGIVIDEETGRKAEEFNDNLSRLQGAFGALATKVSAEMLPTLVSFTNTVVDNSGAIASLAGELNKAAQGFGILTSKVAEGGRWLDEYYAPIVERTRKALRGWGVPVFDVRAGGGNSTMDVVNALKRAAASSSPQIERLGTVSEAAGSRIGRIAPPARGASSSLRRMGQDADDTARKMESLMDRLFPLQAANRKFDEDLALIRKSRLSDAEKEVAIARRQRQEFEARTRGFGAAEISRNLISEPISDAAKEIMASKDDIGKSLEELQGKSRIQTVRVADNFAQMSQRIVGALQGLSNSIRSGDFLGILGGVLDLFTQLGSTGLFGRGLASRINSARSFDGGGFTGMGARAGGLDGKGGFLAMLHPRESVIDHTKGGGGGGQIHVTVGVDPRSGNLTAFVDNRFAAMAPAVGAAASAEAVNRIQRMQSRRLA